MGPQHADFGLGDLTTRGHEDTEGGTEETRLNVFVPVDAPVRSTTRTITPNRFSPVPPFVSSLSSRGEFHSQHAVVPETCNSIR